MQLSDHLGGIKLCVLRQKHIFPD